MTRIVELMVKSSNNDANLHFWESTNQKFILGPEQKLAENKNKESMSWKKINHSRYSKIYA